ncbi:MAG: YggS family pyridoxal phosphate-dependent enzyme [Candidatus Aminicenantes bacterium]|nr:YggS family pyridoxal phosphate-dependent enzyme [Candidatus Aminicenantes bacterium]
MTIRENLERIKENIAEACCRSGRDPRQVRLMAVCKDQGPEKIRQALGLGVRLLGENKSQEAEAHMRHLPEGGIEWHFIGNLQKNKINKILSLFHLIESVDGVKTLEHIHKRVDDGTEVYIEINIGEEKSKSGFTAEGLKRAMPYIAGLAKVNITGLMAVPPYFEDTEKVRPYFARLRQLRDDINRQAVGNMKIAHLSMGMSHDYAVAVEEGATLLRIGTALFGRRKP